MKKSLILLALVAYFVIGAYSVTRTKGSAFNAANAQPSNANLPAVQFRLFTQQPEALMKFYSAAFNTDWQAVEGSYQGEVLNATVQVIPTKTKNRTRRVTLPLRSDDLESHTSNLLTAGGSVRAQGASYVVNDPDGNLIVLGRQ